MPFKAAVSLVSLAACFLSCVAFAEHGSFKQSVVNILDLLRGTEGFINTFQICSLARDKKVFCIC